MPKWKAGGRYMGIDPGASGGVAVIGPGMVTFHHLSISEADVWGWISGWGVESPFTSDLFAVIEKVGGYISGNAQPGSAMFKFGKSFGGLQMALIAARIPFEEVTPQAWQKGLGIPPRKKDETKTQWKNRLRSHAQRLFPQEKITLAVADAVLIAEFCRRKREGRL